MLHNQNAFPFLFVPVVPLLKSQVSVPMAAPKLSQCPTTSSQPEPTDTIHNASSASAPVPVLNWFCARTGIYNSTHKPLQLPTTPFLDVVSHILSHNHTHNGKSLSSPALIDSSSGASLSYSTLHQMIKSTASGLHHIFGISQGDAVLILLPNTIFFPVIFLGILSTGAIATTMNPLSSLNEVKKQIASCNVTLVFATSGNAQIEKLGVKAIGVPSNSFRELISGGRNITIPRPVINQEDTAAILYSSGTSGVTKGVVLSHKNFIAVVELFVRFEALQQNACGIGKSHENVYLAAVPMFHIYGLSLFAMGLLSLGTSVVVMNKFDANEMVTAIDRYKVTHFPLVPPILIELAKRKALLGDSHLESLKQVSCGAAPLSEKKIHDFLRVFRQLDFIQGYGMTESTAVGTRGWNTGKFRKYNSVGILAPNMQAKVVDCRSGSCLPPGSSGELWLKGPGIMKGYLNDADATKSAVDKDGWLHTGDIVHFDQDGYLYISDRLKEMIKYKGFQIAPADLEAVLTSHPEILDVAVTAFTDEDDGELPVAFVVKRPGSMLSQADVINYVASKVAPYKKVRKVVFTQSIPKSAAGKILRRELRSSLASKI